MSRMMCTRICAGVALAVSWWGSLGAAPQSRTATAAQLQEAIKDLGEENGSDTTKPSQDPARTARLRSNFSRAVELYAQRPDDAAGLAGIKYVFAYCAKASADEGDRCGKVLPRAKQMLLDHWVGSPEVLEVLPFSGDLDFLDAVYKKSPQERLSIARAAAKQVAVKFHDPRTSETERQRAYDLALKFGKVMMADKHTGTLDGKTIPITRWEGEGLITSVQKMGVGKVMPDFGFTTLDRRRVSFSSQRGKVLLVDFWATWCVPCVRTMPVIKKFREEMQTQGMPFEVVSVNYGDSIEQVMSFQKKKKPDMPWINWHQEIGTEDYFRVALQGLPTYFVLDRSGVILARGEHFDEAMKQRIHNALGLKG